MKAGVFAYCGIETSISNMLTLSHNDSNKMFTKKLDFNHSIKYSLYIYFCILFEANIYFIDLYKPEADLPMGKIVHLFFF